MWEPETPPDDEGPPPGHHDQPQPPSAASVGWEVLRTGRLLYDLGEALYLSFPHRLVGIRTTVNKEAVQLGTLVFLGHFGSEVDLVPGFEQLAHLRVDQYVTVHLLQSLFSILFSL